MGLRNNRASFFFRGRAKSEECEPEISFTVKVLALSQEASGRGALPDAQSPSCTRPSLLLSDNQTGCLKDLFAEKYSGLLLNRHFSPSRVASKHHPQKNKQKRRASQQKGLRSDRLIWLLGRIYEAQ